MTRRWARAAMAAGAASLAVALASGRAALAVAALDASWLFFAGLAAGAVAVGAAIRLSGGRWAGAVLPVADAASAFFAPALLLLVAVAPGVSALLVPGASVAAGVRLTALELSSAAVVFVLGARHVTAARGGAPASQVRGRAAAYLVAYAVGLSVWAWGLAMRVGAGAHFTMLPVLSWYGGFLAGLASVALVASARGLGGEAVRHDVGKLLFGCAAVWAYLAWSIFLPTWYGNVPEDSAALLARWGSRGPATIAVLGAAAAAPLALLFAERGKRSRAVLGAAALSTLLGLWGERHLLVLPSLALPGDAASALLAGGVAIGVAGLFLRSAGAAMIRADPET